MNYIVYDNVNKMSNLFGELFDGYSSIPNPSSLTSPSNVTQQNTAMNGALLALVDEFDGYQGGQQEPAILGMYVTQIETMAYNLNNFYNALYKDKNKLQTYINNLNGAINSLLQQKNEMEMTAAQISSKSNLTSTMQTEMKMTMDTQTYINYSLYVGIVLEVLAMGYALYLPNTHNPTPGS